MNTKKFVSMVTAASLFTLSLSGCSLLGGKDKAAIEETATSYIGYIMSGKLNKSAALVVDEEDYFQENAFPVQQEDGGIGPGNLEVRQVLPFHRLE